MNNEKDLIESTKKFIRWREVSRFLSGSSNAIRSDYMIEKNQEKNYKKVKELLEYVEQWKNKK